MMRSNVTIIAMILFVSLIAGVSYGQLSIDAMATMVKPNGDFDNNFDASYGGALQAFISLPLLPFEVGGRVAYNRFSADGMFEGGRTTVFEMIPSIRFIILPKISPVNLFTQFGAGYYKWDAEIDASNIRTVTGLFNANADGTDFGFYIAAGIRAKLGPTMGLIVMPMYHMVNNEGDKIKYVSLNAGVTF